MGTSEVSGADAHGFEHDAFISYTRADRAWALRLEADLRSRGFTAVTEIAITGAGSTMQEALNAALDTARALIVLWTPRAQESQSMGLEIATFLSHVRRDDAEDRADRLVLPVYFEDALDTAPPEITSWEGVVIGPEVSAAELASNSASWSDAIDVISAFLARDPRSARVRVVNEQPSQILPRSDAVVVMGGKTRHCWQIAGDMVVGAFEPKSLPNHALVVKTESGATAGTVARWRSPTRDRLAGLAAIRLDPPLALPRPAPTAPPRVERLVQVWQPPFLRHVGEGVVARSGLEKGAFELQDLQGTCLAGSLVWDAEQECVVGMLGRDDGTPTEVTGRPGPASVPLLSVEEIRLHAGLSLAIEPTPPPSAHVHDDGWTIDDRLDHALYARAIAEFIRHPDTKPPLAIGVQGPWGQGKTSLMRMVQSRLDPEHPDLPGSGARPSAGTVDGPSALTFKDLRDSLSGEIPLGDVQPSKVRTVWFNAWKYQSSESLWAGLANAILAQLPNRLARRERELFWLKLQLRRIDATAVRQDIYRVATEWLLPRLASVVALAVIVIALAATGVLGTAAGLLGGTAAFAYAAGLWWRARRKALERKLEGSYLRYVSQPDYDGKMGYLHQVEGDMREALALLTPDDSPTVIFIDDLDRCSPAKIGQVLEAINLFLSGEYPNCVFVLGIDDEVVAAAMEIVHGEVIGRLENRRSEMGWRFMDKFVQLSFAMPRLTERQRNSYLTSLLSGSPSTDGDEAASRAAADAEQVRRELQRGGLRPGDAAKRVGELAPDLAAAGSDEWRDIAEEVISLGARDFSDGKSESIAALRSQLPHLSDNPRTIKRAVNLYRFYQFTAWARDASPLDLDSADPDLIARWIVIAVRWPQVVRWLQVNGELGADPVKRIRDSWLAEEPELCSFLEGENGPDLARAGDCGLW